MTPRAGHALVALDGTVDDRTVGLLGKSLDRVLDLSGPSLVLDLSAAKMMSVDWVSAVNAARGRAAERGGRVVFVSPSETAKIHVDLLELARVYPSLASIEEAERNLTGKESGERFAALPPAPSADDLAGELGDPDPAVRRRAACALAELGKHARAAAPALARALRDDDGDVRLTALGALKALGPAAESVVWDIVDCLRDESVRALALEALVAIGPASLGAVRTIVADPDPAVSQSAAQALRVIQERLR
ncbi:MAG: HEAT repeat domain-containing protein [Planctomycetes bacterium]|nr:HEAT repeat domain-containing protein [Planctomycetota bacterium]